MLVPRAVTCSLISDSMQLPSLCGDQPSVSTHWFSGCLRSPLVHCSWEGRALVSHHNRYMINNSRVDRCPASGGGRKQAVWKHLHPFSVT